LVSFDESFIWPICHANCSNEEYNDFDHGYGEYPPGLHGSLEMVYEPTIELGPGSRSLLSMMTCNGDRFCGELVRFI